MSGILCNVVGPTWYFKFPLPFSSSSSDPLLTCVYLFLTSSFLSLSSPSFSSSSSSFLPSLFPPPPPPPPPPPYSSFFLSSFSPCTLSPLHAPFLPSSLPHSVYVANRVSDKLTQISDHIFCCRSGSSADTQATADIVKAHLNLLRSILGIHLTLPLGLSSRMSKIHVLV